MIFSKLIYVGMCFLVVGVHVLLSGIAGLVTYFLAGDHRELHISVVFVVCGLASLAIAFSLLRLPKPELSREDAFLVGILLWILTPLISAIPLTLASGIHYIDAVFESVSGWTTTGLTLFVGEQSSLGSYLPTPDELPTSLKFWRSLSQWIGGLGVLTLIAYLLAGRRLSAAHLYSVEGRFQRISSNIYVAIKELSLIYVIFTAVSIAILYFAGMTFYDAVHHAMTGIATGGFSTHSESVGFYDTRLVHMAVFLVMFLGATSFLDLYHIVRFKWIKLWGSVEFKALTVMCVIMSLLTLLLWITDPIARERFEDPLALIFSVLSGLTTSGFTVIDVSKTDEAFKFLTIVAMLIGGSAFSTAGGIKILRIVIIARSVSWEIESSLKSSGYMSPKRIGSYVIDDAILRRTLVTATLYVVSVPLFAIILWIAFEGAISFIDAMFESASAITGTGLSVGIARASAPLEVKLTLCIAMLLGRLEILAFLVAASALISRSLGTLTSYLHRTHISS
ncbi:MAG: TrkH family potassium uptake protein [Acidilobaceae archaeon]